MPSAELCHLPAIALLALAMLSGCSREQPPPNASSTRAPSQLAMLSTSDLRGRARVAFVANRLYAPAGKNAAEYLLALRDRDLASDADRFALADLEPYLVIAIEQAIERRDEAEAMRIRGLLRQANPDAPALQRLAAAVDRLHADTIEQARAATAEQVAPSANTSPGARLPAPETIRLAPAPAPVAVAERAAVVATGARSSVALNDPVSTSTVSASSTAPAAPVTAAPAEHVAAQGMPQLLRDVTPDYPRAAFAHGIEGEVEVRFTIDSDGHVRDVRAITSNPGGVFDRAAVAAASRWVFESGHAPVTTTRRLAFHMPET